MKLLPEVTGFEITNQYYSRELKLIGDKAKLTQPITAHIARHAFATIALNSGAPIEIVQALMGHSDIKTTQIYAKLMDNTKAKALAKWNE